MNDAELGVLTWNEQPEWWEGSIRLTSTKEFQLVVFARSSLIADRSITADARVSIERIRTAEDACRSYACGELLDIHNSEWSEGNIIDADEFKRRLEPDWVEVHESGYSEVHRLPHHESIARACSAAPSVNGTSKRAGLTPETAVAAAPREP